MKNSVPFPSAAAAKKGLCARWCWLWVPAVLSACSSYSPTGLPPGASIAQAEHDLGRRTAAYALPDGGQRLEFARGPAGKDTYMLDFDAQGHLLKWEQVLTEPNFAEIRKGLSEAEVLSRIGHPAVVNGVGFSKWRQRVWSYRYTHTECLWFQVGFDLQGQVVDSGYGIDPACDIRE